MERLVEVMNGIWGRLAKVALGLALIAIGLVVLGPLGIVLAAFGIFWLGLGLSGRCVLELFVRSHPRHPRELGH